MVRSSSFERAEEEDSFKLGLMQTGGIGRSCTINDFIFVLPETFISNHYFYGILLSICKASHGFNS